jgi:hypothetical protein
MRDTRHRDLWIYENYRSQKSAALTAGLGRMTVVIVTMVIHRNPSFNLNIICCLTLLNVVELINYQLAITVWNCCTGESLQFLSKSAVCR